MKTKLQFGDKDAIRLLRLDDILKDTKEIIQIEPEDEDDFYIYECPHCHDLDNFDDEIHDDDNLSIWICNSCGKKSATEYIMDEFKALKKQFK